MTPEIRLEILKITRPNVDNPDMELWLKRAGALEAYVHGAGQPEQSVRHEPVTQAHEVRTPRRETTPATA